MTDKEITEIIVTGVMGWHLCTCLEEQLLCCCESEPPDSFDPLTSDADVMMAWDKCVERLFDKTDFSIPFLTILNTEGGKTGADRRRAMCECMAKAVQHEED
jgi:hypothetical protein